MKKTLFVASVCALLCVFLSASIAFGEMTYFSNSTFLDATVQSTTSGKVTFTARLRARCASVSVTSCSLEKLENGTWKFVKSLSLPDGKTNASRYTASKDYSSSLVEGSTYRFKATFSADGEKTTRTSGSITY